MERNWLLISGLALILNGCATITVEEKQIMVAPNKVSCVEIPGECFLIKNKFEGKWLPIWEITYEPILNFQYEAGYRYLLTVTKHGWLPGVIPPRGNVRHDYELLQVLEKVPDNKIYAPGQP